jgi:hypothetical protein
MASAIMKDKAVRPKVEPLEAEHKSPVIAVTAFLAEILTAMLPNVWEYWIEGGVNRGGYGQIDI